MSEKPEDVSQEAWDAAVAMWNRGRGMDDIARAIDAAVSAQIERDAGIAEAVGISMVRHRPQLRVLMVPVEIASAIRSQAKSARYLA